MPRSNTLYSEEIQEIMGRIPGWVIRWGITVFCILFLLLLSITYAVKYPETISGPIVLTTVNPPVDLISKSSNKIEYLFVKDGELVQKDEIIAILYNSAESMFVLELEKILLENSDNWESYFSSDFLTKNYSLGELQSYYMQFIKQCVLFDHYIKTDFSTQKQKLIQDNIAKTERIILSQAKQMALIKEDLSFEESNLSRDSVLVNLNALTKTEYERSRQSMLQKQIALINQNTAMTSTQANLVNIKQQLLELEVLRDKEITNYKIALSESREQLLAQINLWRDRYVFKSPIEGKVSFIKYWSTNQNINIGDRLATVVPDDSVQVIGKMHIPSQGFAKVKVNQTVNVKLSGFPYMEYGILKGTINSLSSIPEAQGYAAEVVFNNGLISSYNTHFQFIHQMDGIGDIITKDQRLLERFLKPLKSAIKNDM